MVSAPIRDLRGERAQASARAMERRASRPSEAQLGGDAVRCSSRRNGRACNGGCRSNLNLVQGAGLVEYKKQGRKGAAATMQPVGSSCGFEIMTGFLEIDNEAACSPYV